MATPSPSPLTPTPPATQSSIGSFEKLPSPKSEIEHGALASFSSFAYLTGKQSPVKLMPLSDDLALDFCPTSDDGNRHMFKTRKLMISILSCELN